MRSLNIKLKNQGGINFFKVIMFMLQSGRAGKKGISSAYIGLYLY